MILQGQITGVNVKPGKLPDMVEAKVQILFVQDRTACDFDSLTALLGEAVMVSIRTMEVGGE